MVKRFSFIIAIILLLFGYGSGENLWCYECNTILNDGHTGECNDPYAPRRYFDLVSCPQNESQHCLKGIIFYRNVHVTIRGCVPSREIDGYCRHEKHFPQSVIECYFCKDYACNAQGTFHLFTSLNFTQFLFLLFLSIYFI